MTTQPPGGPVRSFRRRGLGRGLDALLPGSEPLADPDSGALVQVGVDMVQPNPEQPRRDFDKAELDALADSIRDHGLLQPLVVRRTGAGYQLVAGERRLRAARLAGLATVPAVVRESSESDRESLELALVENLLREDLNPIEEAEAYARLADGFGMSHEAIALRLRRSRSAVSNAVRLLALPAPVRDAVAAGRLSAGHARAILAIPDLAGQMLLAARIMDEGMSVREAERYVRARIAEPAAGSRGGAAAAPPRRPGAAAEPPSGMSPDEAALAKGFEDALGLPVELRRSAGGSGQLVIRFAGDEDLDALYTRVGGRPL